MPSIKGRFTGLIDGEFVEDAVLNPGPAPEPPLNPVTDPTPTNPPVPSGLDLSASAFKTADDWETFYESKWGPLGPQTPAQIDKLANNAKAGVYDDAPGHLAWHTHYWIRSWVILAEVTGRMDYLDTCVSMIDYMLDHTDERRVERGEIIEYIRDPMFLKQRGGHGPFWVRNRKAGVLTTGQIVHAIMVFVDYVYENNLTA
ncbi:MAG: hypothetical protein IH993_07870, partial [Proteobacteria bacterium]|nr:hypothetical protein [Pseudomonadota bacterium]